MSLIFFPRKNGWASRKRRSHCCESGCNYLGILLTLCEFYLQILAGCFKGSRADFAASFTSPDSLERRRLY